MAHSSASVDARATASSTSGTPPPKKSSVDSGSTYFADGFRIPLREEWEVNTVYRIAGPVEDEFEHRIDVRVNRDIGDVSVADYAEQQIEKREQALEKGRLLERTRMKLNNGLPTSRASFALLSDNDRRLYQEEWYVVYGDIGYRITAQFTADTLESVGPIVEDIVRHFDPHAPLSQRR